MTGEMVVGSTNVVCARAVPCEADYPVAAARDATTSSCKRILPCLWWDGALSRAKCEVPITSLGCVKSGHLLGTFNSRRDEEMCGNTRKWQSARRQGKTPGNHGQVLDSPGFQRSG